MGISKLADTIRFLPWPCLGIPRETYHGFTADCEGLLELENNRHVRVRAADMLPGIRKHKDVVGTWWKAVKSIVDSSWTLAVGFQLRDFSRWTLTYQQTRAREVGAMTKVERELKRQSLTFPTVGDDAERRVTAVALCSTALHGSLSISAIMSTQATTHRCRERGRWQGRSASRSNCSVKPKQWLSRS